MIPQWLSAAMQIFGLLGVGGFLSAALLKWYNNKYPSKLEHQQLNTNRVDFLKSYNDAQAAHLQLTETLKKMVAEETEQFRNLLVQRELEHSQQMEGFIKKAAEEKMRADDYWEQLQEQKQQTIYWRTQYENLKSKYEPEPRKTK